MTVRERRQSRNMVAPLAIAESILAGSDPIDLATWERLLAADAHVRVANRRVVVGKPSCMAELKLLLDQAAALGRGFREVWPSRDGETVLMEVDLVPCYGVTPLPLAIIVRMIAPEPVMRDVRFYLDPAPLGL